MHVCVESGERQRGEIDWYRSIGALDPEPAVSFLNSAARRLQLPELHTEVLGITSSNSHIA